MTRAKVERNQKIVDLRDDEHKSFGQIAKELKMDKAWAYHIYIREISRPRKDL